MNVIIKGDCIEKLKEIPDETFNLIYADPPYNLQIEKDLIRRDGTKVKGVRDDWDKFESIKDYEKFSHDWLKECRRVLKKNGTIWVMGDFHNIFRVGKIMQDMDYWIINDILWIKPNPVPNLMGTKFSSAHETLIWAAKSKSSKYTFNYKTMKAYNDDKQMRSDWVIPIVNGNSRIKNEKGEKAHPTQKPEALVYRAILASSKEGDSVLDLFSGTGTTSAIAKKLNRKYTAIERDENYVKIAKDRLKKVKPLDDKMTAYYLEIKTPRISFGSLMETGYIKAGDMLYSSDRKTFAEVMADSSLKNNQGTGSIHSLCAKVEKKLSSNGWHFWNAEVNGKLKSINEFRKEYEQKYLKTSLIE